MPEYLRLKLIDRIPDSWPSWLTVMAICAGICIVAIITYYIAISLLRILEKIISRTPTTWDDDLLTPRLLRAFSQLAPALTVNWLLPSIFGQTPQTFRLFSTLTSFYILWALIHMIYVVLDNLYTAMYARAQTRPYAIKGVFQMFKIILVAVGIIIGLSLLIGKAPLAILTALGASAAVLSLVFKDTILGLVASVQLTANNMLRRGDWIVVPGLDANGEVQDISLTTVKVRNWDNSITTVPPYSLISGPFRNYQPMRHSGARRVDRAVYIDINSVRYLTPSELAELRAGGFIPGEDTTADVDRDERMVNLSLLRRYLEKMISEHPHVSKDSMLMVRQLDPTPSGLPVQMYFFLNDTEWVAYEHSAADIMDQIYASMGRFGLRIFQTPAGSDLRTLTDR